jgi:hypothetical protein
MTVAEGGTFLMSGWRHSKAGRAGPGSDAPFFTLSYDKAMYFMALLAESLLERELRRAMEREASG